MVKSSLHAVSAKATTHVRLMRVISVVYDVQ